MCEFVKSERIRGSESPDQAELKFLRGCYSRLIHTTEEQSEKCVSMTAILLEVKKTLSQISNQLGIHTIEAESSHQTPPVTFSASYVRDDQNRLPTTDEHTEKFDSMEALLREMKQAPSIEMPEFDASNVSDWLSKVERSFPARRYSDLDRLDLVAFSLEGDVLLWFASEMSRSEFHSWDEFRRRLFVRFAATPEASSETVTESLEARASYQVPVSSLEHGLSFSKESLVVSEARPSDIVSHNRVQSQSVLDCVKNKTNAYQVFDKTSPHKERLKPKTKRKLSLSPKTWMFKFKHTSNKRKSLDVKSFSVEEIAWLMRDSKEIYRSCVDKEFKAVVAGCGKQLFDRFQIVDGTSTPAVYGSMLLCNLRVRQDPRGLGQLILDDLKSHLRHKWKSKQLRAVYPQTNPSYALDVVNKTSKPWETHTTFTSTPVASVNSLSLEVVTAGNMFRGLSQTSQVWEPGGVIAANVLVDWLVDFNGYDGIVDGIRRLAIDSRRVANWSSGLSQNRQVWEPGGVLAAHVLEDNVEAGSKGLAYAGCVLLGMNCAGLGSGKEELLATGQQMQRTDLFAELTCSQNKKQMLGYKTWMFKYKSSLRITRSASRDMNQFVGFMKFQLKHKWRSKHLHTISALGFYLSSVFSTVPSAPSGRLQGLLEQVLQKDDEAYPQILDKLQLYLKQGMDVHGASGLRLFLCQQKFSSIWHRWRRKDSDLEVQLKERALVQSSVSPELLDEAVWIPEVGCRELLVKWQDHDASENFWMFSKDFVQLYPSSKLEDKLVFEGGSIDTIKQSYYRKKKPWVETEGFSCKEALEGNGGFAVSLEV